MTEFVEDLRKAIVEEAATIRETELDKPSDIELVTVVTRGGFFIEGVPASVDKLGRVHLFDIKRVSKDISSLKWDERPAARVVRVEERFEGHQPVELVCYMEAIDVGAV